MDDRLALAHELYAGRDFLQAFALCQEVLDDRPDCVDALILFANLCLIGEEYLTAVQCLRLAQHIDPNHPGTAILLTQDIAHEGYREVVKRDPDLANHTSAHVFASPLLDGARDEAILREVIALQPGFARAHAALGNLLCRTGNLADGLPCYARSVELDAKDAGVRLGYAERLRLHGNEALAREHLARALELSHTYREASSGIAGEETVLALCAQDFWENHILVDMLIDRETISLTKRFLTRSVASPTREDAPAPGVIVCALADPHNHEAIDAATAYIAGAGRPFVNDPQRLARTDRTYLPSCRHLHRNLRIPATVRVSASRAVSAGAPLPFPFLLRPESSHRGEGLVLVRTADDWADLCGRSPRFDGFATEYVEYADSDGFYRKYRFIFVDGVPYAYHLAISAQWMVHYFSAPMEGHEWMRDEETAFLRSPFERFGARRWEALLAVAREVGLDYFGIDCAIAADDVLVFEANANMLVQNAYGDGIFAYKQRAFAAVSAAFNAMLRARRSPG